MTWLTFDSPKVQAYGLPKSPSDEMLEAIKGKIVIDILDPDIKDNKRTRVAYKDIDYRVMRLPMKIDDMILSAKLTKEDLRGMMKQARKA